MSTNLLLSLVDLRQEASENVLLQAAALIHRVNLLVDVLVEGSFI